MAPIASANRNGALRHFGMHALDHAAVALYDAG